MKAVLYIHGKGGIAAECEQYAPLFPGCDVSGLDYRSFTPWETGEEIRTALGELCERYESVTLIANSVGAFFSMCAGIGRMISGAFFISPIVDMEKLILGMMERAGVSEAELERCGVIPTDAGEELSWEYLKYVRTHPVEWDAPTEIFYGSNDALTSPDTVAAFAKKHGARLNVMEGGEHWFHTKEQMEFIVSGIKNSPIYNI